MDMVKWGQWRHDNGGGNGITMTAGGDEHDSNGGNGNATTAGQWQHNHSRGNGDVTMLMVGHLVLGRAKGQRRGWQ